MAYAPGTDPGRARIGTGIDGIRPELFHQGARITAVGTLVFLADVVL